MKIKKLILILIVFCYYACDSSETTKEVIVESYPDNTPKLVRIYNDGKDDYLEINYYINSQKERERMIKDGYPNGSWIEWHKNGNLKFQKNYFNGEMHGTQKGWYMNEEIFFESNYIMGELISRKIYNHDGSVKSEL